MAQLTQQLRREQRECNQLKVNVVRRSNQTYDAAAAGQLIECAY
jgi:hypothetical protein